MRSMWENIKQRQVWSHDGTAQAKHLRTLLRANEKCLDETREKDTRATSGCCYQCLHCIFLSPLSTQGLRKKGAVGIALSHHVQSARRDTGNAPSVGDGTGRRGTRGTCKRPWCTYYEHVLHSKLGSARGQPCQPTKARPAHAS